MRMEIAGIVLYKVVFYTLGAVFGVVALVLLWAALMALFDAWEDWE